MQWFKLLILGYFLGPLAFPLFIKDRRFVLFICVVQNVSLSF